jgi:hypothetical protein
MKQRGQPVTTRLQLPMLKCKCIGRMQTSLVILCPHHLIVWMQIKVSLVLWPAAFLYQSVSLQIDSAGRDVVHLSEFLIAPVQPGNNVPCMHLIYDVSKRLQAFGRCSK